MFRTRYSIHRFIYRGINPMDYPNTLDRREDNYSNSFADLQWVSPGGSLGALILGMWCNIVWKCWISIPLFFVLPGLVVVAG